MQRLSLPTGHPAAGDVVGVAAGLLCRGWDTATLIPGCTAVAATVVGIRTQDILTLITVAVAIYLTLGVADASFHGGEAVAVADADAEAVEAAIITLSQTRARNSSLHIDEYLGMRVVMSASTESTLVA